MANDPRTFTIVCPPKSGAAGGARRNTLVDAITKASGLDVHNKVFNGLRTLTKTYNVLSNVPIVGDGVKEVAAATQLPVPFGSIVERFNPAVANQAGSAMKQIGQKIKQRNFKVSDIPQYIADLDNFGKLASRIIAPENKFNGTPLQVCGISPYATDLVGLGAKQKFLFVAEFTFSSIGNAAFDFSDNGFAIFIKQFDRPNVTYNYDDINMYNFRTRVLKSVTYEPVNMHFYDDATNRVMSFLNHYISATSPIYNYRGNVFEEDLMKFNPEQTQLLGPGSSADNTVSTGKWAYPASVGLVSDDANGPQTVISQIKVYHVYNYGQRANIYTLARPKINSIQLDELNMEESGVNSACINLSYDQLSIDLDVPFSELQPRQPIGQYPLRYVGDASTAGEPRKTSVYDTSPTDLSGEAKTTPNTTFVTFPTTVINLLK